MPGGNSPDLGEEKLQMYEGQEVTKITKEDGRIRIYLEGGWYFEFEEYNHGSVFDLV